MIRRSAHTNVTASRVRLSPHIQSYPTDGCEGVIGGKHPSVLDCGLTPQVVFNPSVVHIHQSHPLLSSGGPLNNYQHALAAAETVELEFMITCRKDSVSKGVVDAHFATSLDTFAKVDSTTNSKRARGGVPYQGVLTSSRPLLCPHVPSQSMPMLLSPLGTPQPTIDRAQENINALQKNVDTALGHVAELELIAKCLKMSIAMGRNLTKDEYTVLEKGANVCINLGYVRATTTLETFTKVEAEGKIEKAEAKIKEAKAKIEKAKLEIEKAKLEIKESKSLENYYTPETFVAAADNHDNHVTFKIIGNALTGRSELIGQIHQLLQCHQPPTVSQQSFSIVLIGTNGVGKTHCSFLIGSDEFNNGSTFAAVSVYCGVNNRWLLSPVERDYVKDFNTLQDVLYTRIALALHHRANNMSSPWDSLSIRDTKILPRETSYRFIVTAISKIKKSLNTRYPKRAVVVFGVVDEVQELEEEFKRYIDEPSRTVLRILRELQIRIFSDTAVLFVGFGTGTLFRSNLLDKTKGRNLSVSESFCERSEFSELIANTDVKRRIITRMIYPRVRLIGGSPRTWHNNIGDVPVKNAITLLPSALTQTPIHLTEFEGCIAFVGAQEQGNSQDMFMPLDDYILMVTCVEKLTSFRCDPRHFTDSFDCFESWVGEALCAVLALATSEKAGQAVRTAILAKNNWVGHVLGRPDFELRHVRLETPDHTKVNIMPFTGAGSLKKAISGGVNPQITDIVDDMEPNSLVMICCKGSAPFDYLMFAKGSRGELRGALFDAKHSEKGKSETDDNARDIRSKYLVVTKALKKKFKKLTMAPPFIVTNKKVPKGVKNVVYITGDNLRLGGLTRAAFDSLDD